MDEEARIIPHVLEYGIRKSSRHPGGPTRSRDNSGGVRQKRVAQSINRSLNEATLCRRIVAGSVDLVKGTAHHTTPAGHSVHPREGLRVGALNPIIPTLYTPWDGAVAL